MAMRATVVRIISASERLNPKLGRAVQLKVEGADMGYERVQVSESELGIVGVQIDDVVELEFAPARSMGDWPAGAVRQ